MLCSAENGEGDDEVEEVGTKASSFKVLGMNTAGIATNTMFGTSRAAMEMKVGVKSDVALVDFEVKIEVAACGSDVVRGNLRGGVADGDPTKSVEGSVDMSVS